MNSRYHGEQLRYSSRFIGTMLIFYFLLYEKGSRHVVQTATQIRMGHVCVHTRAFSIHWPSAYIDERRTGTVTKGTIARAEIYS